MAKVLPGKSHWSIVFCQSSLRRFLVKRGKIVAGATHHFHHFVERNAMRSVGQTGIEIGVKRTSSRVSITFNAGNLNESANRVASHSEVVLKTHFRCIFYLRRTSSEELNGSSCTHSTSHTHFALASHFRTGNGGVLLHDISDETGRCESPQNTCFGEMLALPEVVENTWQNTAGTAGGSRHDLAAGGVFLAHGQGIGKDESAAAEIVVVAGYFYVVIGGSSAQIERPWEHAFLVDSPFNRSNHHMPYFGEIIPYFGTFALFHIFPIIATGLIAILENGRHGVKRIDFWGNEAVAFFRKRSAADAVNSPYAFFAAIRVKGAEAHSVRMERKEYLGFPMDEGARKNVEYSHIGHVAFTGSGKTSVERHFIGNGLGIAATENLGRVSRTHSMTAGRAVADAVDLFDGFHKSGNKEMRCKSSKFLRNTQIRGLHEHKKSARTNASAGLNASAEITS